MGTHIGGGDTYTKTRDQIAVMRERQLANVLRENGRLRAALEEIVRESNGVNKGAVAQKIAIDALAANGP